MSFINHTVTLLNNHGVILVPTDTHFALAASPMSALAMARLLAFKQELAVSTLTFCFSDRQQIWPWIKVTAWQHQQIERLGKKFWPGALKLSVKGSPRLLNYLAADEVITISCMRNQLLSQLIQKLDTPLTVIPALCPEQSEALVSFTRAREYYGSRVDWVVPSNNKPIFQQATTHLSLLDDRYEIIRAGALDLSGCL